jgi:DNA-binding LacI/PurR family transcriptional regulator
MAERMPVQPSACSSPCNRLTISGVPFLRYTSELLADYLRERILLGEVREPLPGIRTWSQQLGVSRDSLSEALRMLQRQGLVSVRRKGVRLTPIPSRARPRATRGVRIVRVLYHGYISLHEDLDWIEMLSESLHRQEIQLTLERCNAKRLRAIVGAPINPQEMFLLSAIPDLYCSLLSRARTPSLLIGLPSPGSPLPFITLDQEGAVRHATQSLLRRGFDRMDMLNFRYSAAGVARGSAAFEETCRQWPHQPVRAETILLPVDSPSLHATVLRYAQRIEGRRGILVVAPVPLTLVQTALLQRGVRLPEQVQLVSLFHAPASLQVHPAPTYYRFSRPRIVKAIQAAVLHYFETGDVPAVRKMYPVELVLP